MTKPKSQIDKFRKAAADHEANDNETAFNAALKAIATGKGVSESIDRLATELGQHGDKSKSRARRRIKD